MNLRDLEIKNMRYAGSCKMPGDMPLITHGNTFQSEKWGDNSIGSPPFNQQLTFGKEQQGHGLQKGLTQLIGSGMCLISKKTDGKESSTMSPTFYSKSEAISKFETSYKKKDTKHSQSLSLGFDNNF